MLIEGGGGPALNAAPFDLFDEVSRFGNGTAYSADNHHAQRCVVDGGGGRVV